MSTSSGRTPFVWKSCRSWPHGASGASAGRGPRPVSTSTVCPLDRIRYEPRLNRTLSSCVRCDAWGRQSPAGMVGKKLQRSNSSIPSDRDMISTSPTRMTWLAMAVSRAPSRRRCLEGCTRRAPARASTGRGRDAHSTAAPARPGARACPSLRGALRAGKGIAYHRDREGLPDLAPATRPLHPIPARRRHRGVRRVWPSS